MLLLDNALCHHLYVGIARPFLVDKILELKIARFNHRWSVTYANVMKFLEGLGMYSCHVFIDLLVKLQEKVIN